MKTFAASALPSTIVALMHVLVAGSNTTTNKHDETDKTKTSQTYDIYESLGLIQKTLHQIKEEVKYQTSLKMEAHALTPSHGTLQSDVKSRMQLEATPRPGQSKEKLQSEGNGEDGSFIRRQPRMTTAAARRYVRKMNKLLLRTGVQTQCPWPDNVMDEDSEDGGGGNGSEHSYLSTSSESIPSTTKFIDEEEEGEPGQQQENADDKENADPASVAEVVLSQNDTPTTTTRARSVKTKKIQILPLDLSGENTEVERARMKRAQLKRLRKL